MKKFLFVIILFSFNYMYGQYGVNERGFKLEGGYYSCNDTDYELVSIDRFSKIWYNNVETDPYYNTSRNDYFWVSNEYYDSGRPKSRSMVTNYDHPSTTLYTVSYNPEGRVTNIRFESGFRGGGTYNEFDFYSGGETNHLFYDNRFPIVNDWKEQIEELGNYYFNICEIDKSINLENLSLDDEIDGIEKYDVLLNKYYQILKKQFTKDGFQKIKLDQREWLNKRGNKIIKQYWTESLQINVNSQLELYKTRVKELINLFYVKLNLPIKWWEYDLPGDGKKIEFNNLYGEHLYDRCYDKLGVEFDCE